MTTHLRISSLLAPLALGTLVACGGAQAPCEDPVADATDDVVVEADELVEAVPVSPEHRLLHAVAWTQTSTEFAAMTTQIYRGAVIPMEDALEDPDWTAVLEQTDAYQELPPAIILDLDETVLDNSPYQAWLIANGQSYGSETWNAWCQAGVAEPIPGVVEFLITMQDMGITPIFVSNRRHIVEDATVANLNAVGIDATADNVWLRDEIDEGSAKSGRRIAVGANYRVIGLFGDNLGDFTDDYHGTLEERDAVADTYDSYWGERWFVLPNPQYGSWVPALAPYDLSVEESANALRDALMTWDGPAAE